MNNEAFLGCSLLVLASLLSCSDSSSTKDAKDASEICQELHPDVASVGAGAGSRQPPEMKRACYVLSPEKQSQGCLPGSSSLLLKESYLSDSQNSCGSQVLSVHSEASQQITDQITECCYDVCSSFSCPGRPLVVEQGVRLAPLHRASDLSWG